ncbi:MAG: hypothetical protein A3C84_00835 [Candidatus Ryanbacteria bacterium RIFCSPHIGHO2_02_FULL_48_12]|uniref:Uncharacterized protein n=1 Tax=Candidatus Ryanbacteria bacterium RIFCSPHIGHO2_01_FULL_48_27 TaxID=1802115 RepID=A0A1G2G3R4_9BACT|nr:MAG: hypothetical protein A2756_03415 [Candidatus Ryanbacteria bacterium RIFCSPHIGHO2_01_FULL_48_27]OGZ48321.1 MAG: hypothetical protein A3C84_00835 [Candidatus Ryanbacteria bacterium RIFCSPHIGHO2_02_FULL_48_12]
MVKRIHIAGILVFLITVLSVFFATRQERQNAKDAALAFDVPVDNLFAGEERYVAREIVLPDDTYITSITPRFSGAGNLLHHADLFYTGADNLVCRGKKLQMYSTGSELNTIETLGPDRGIFLKKGERLLLYIHFANPNDGQKIASGSFRLSLVGSGSARRAVVPVMLSVSHPCDKDVAVSTEYPIPGGVAHHEKNMEQPYRFPRDVVLVAWGGHLHEYGVSLALMHNNKTISTLTPQKNPHLADPKSVYLAGQVFQAAVRIRKGDEINLQAVYEKPENLFITSAMGVGYLLVEFSK